MYNSENHPKDIAIEAEEELNVDEQGPTLRPRRLSSRGSGFLLTKNRADQPRLSNVVQLRCPLPRVENGNKY